MSQAAIAEGAARASSETPATTGTRPAEPAAFDAVQSAWRRNLQAGADAARALQEENAQFASRLMDLNLQAARALGGAGAGGGGLPNPFELSASAVELYLGYLGRSAALAQRAIVLPWTQGQGRS